MSFHFVAKLPTPDEIREQFPVPEHLTQIKHRRDAEIRDVITGKAINSWSSSAPVLPITRTPSAIMSAGSPASTKRCRTS